MDLKRHTHANRPPMILRALCPWIASAALLVLVPAGCSLFTGSGEKPPSAVPVAFQQPNALDWERTIPTVVMADHARTVDLVDFFPGWIERTQVESASPAEAVSDGSKSAPTNGRSSSSAIDSAGAPSVSFPDSGGMRIAPSAPAADAGVKSDTASPANRPTLWFVRFSFHTDAGATPLHRAVAISSRPLADGGIVPVPFELDRRIGEADGAFDLANTKDDDPILPDSVCILFGNEFLPLSMEGPSNPAPPPLSRSTTGNAAEDGKGAFAVEWLSPRRFVVHGLREFAVSRPSDAALRIFGQRQSGQWTESAFPFGGRLRPVFEPRDSVYYFALVDRLPDGRSGNDAPVQNPGVTNPLDNWMGGDAAGLRSLIDDGYFNWFGSGCLVLSAPYLQTPGVVDVPGSGANGTGHRAATGYRGLFTASFGKPDPHFGSLGEWIDTIAAAHRAGLNVMFDYCPWIQHDSGDLVKSDPKWFEGKPPQSKGEASGAADRLDRAEFLAPSLRYGSWDSFADARAAMSGYGLWWLRTVKADGLHIPASDQLPANYLTLFTTRLREEISRPEHQGIYLLGEAFRPPVPAKGMATDDANSGTKTNADPEAEAESARGPVTHFFDGAVDLPLSFAVRDCLAADRGSLVDLDTAIRRSLAAQPVGSIPCLASGSPDLPRFASLAAEGRNEGSPRTDAGSLTAPSLTSQTSRAASETESIDRAHRLLFTALFTLPDVPGIYYGDEIGLAGAAVPQNRAPLPPRGDWNPAERQRFDWVRQLADLRFHHPALRRGTYQPLAADRDTLVYCRAVWSEAVVVGINRSDRARSLEIELPANLRTAAEMKGLLPDNARIDAPIRNGHLTVSLPPGAACVWQVR